MPDELTRSTSLSEEDISARATTSMMMNMQELTLQNIVHLSVSAEITPNWNLLSTFWRAFSAFLQTEFWILPP